APNRRPEQNLTGISVAANRARDILELFGGTRRMYGYGGSQGALSFFGPYSNNPAIRSFHGLILRSGAGEADDLRSSLRYCAAPAAQRSLPLTGLTFISTDPCNVVDFALWIRECDTATSDAIIELIEAGDPDGAMGIVTSYDPFNQRNPV